MLNTSPTPPISSHNFFIVFHLIFICHTLTIYFQNFHIPTVRHPFPFHEPIPLIPFHSKLEWHFFHTALSHLLSFTYSAPAASCTLSMHFGIHSQPLHYHDSFSLTAYTVCLISYVPFSHPWHLHSITACSFSFFQSFLHGPSTSHIFCPSLIQFIYTLWAPHPPTFFHSNILENSPNSHPSAPISLSTPSFSFHSPPKTYCDLTRYQSSCLPLSTSK